MIMKVLSYYNTDMPYTQWQIYCLLYFFFAVLDVKQYILRATEPWQIRENNPHTLL